MFNFKFLYAPNDGAGIGTPTGPGPVSTPGIVDGVTDRDILDGDDDADEIPSTNGRGKKLVQKQEVEDDEPVSDEEDEDDETEEDEESDEDEEEDGDEEEEDDSDDEAEGSDDVDDIDDGNLLKAVKKAAPELFKKVPGLREALERDRQYGEYFASPEEAKVAVRNTQLLSAMYNDISSGDVEKTGNFFKAIKSTSPEAFEDFAHTMIESVGKMDPQLYGSILLKPMKRALMSMYHEAVKTGNKNMAAVAIHAHNYWFDTQDINAPLEERKKATKSKEQEDWEKEKNQYETAKHQEFMGGVTEVVNHSMKLSITKELNGLKLDDYQKRNIIRDIFSGVDEILGADKRYIGGIQTLINEAKNAKFSGEAKSKIVRAYLQRARQALPGVRNKVLKEAGIKVSESKTSPRRLVPAGLGGSNGKDTGIDWSRVDRSRTTDMDILNGTPKYLKK